MGYTFKKIQKPREESRFVDFDQLLSGMSDNQQNALLTTMLERRGIGVSYNEEEEQIEFRKTFDPESKKGDQIYLQAGHVLFAEYLTSKREIEGKYQKNPGVQSGKVESENY